LSDFGDYSLDAGERLIAILAKHAPHLIQRLGPALKLAGEQLEWLSPATMGPSRDGGLYAGKAFIGVPGSIVFVFADKRAVITMHCVLKGSAASMIEEAVADLAVRNIPPLEPPHLAGLIVHFLRRYGAKPNQPPRRPLTEDAASGLLSCMFATVDVAHREAVANGIDACRSSQVCPATVGVVGSASSGKRGFHSLVWPIVLPIAPYLDSVLPALDDSASFPP
jgi:hypothetical protein